MRPSGLLRLLQACLQTGRSAPPAPATPSGLCSSLQPPLQHALEACCSRSSSCSLYTAPTPALEVFDSAVKARHRDRAAYHLLRVHQAELTARDHELASVAQSSNSSDTTPFPSGTSSPTIGNDTSATSSSARAGYRGDALLGGVTSRLLDRLLDVRARSFPNVLVIGGAAVHVLDQLASGVAGIEQVTVVDTSPAMLDAIKVLEAEQRKAGPGSKQWPQLSYALMAEAPEPDQGLQVHPQEGAPTPASQQEREKRAAQMYELLPVEPGTFDLVVSSLGLHWTNDLPGLMFQCRMALKPDGLFLAALFGGETLQELRIACAVAAMERAGGIFPVVSPLAQMRDGGNLLTRAGFALPAVDCDTFVLKYPVDPPSSQQQPHQQQAEQSQKQQQQQQQQQNYSSGARLDECSMQTCEGDGVDSPLGPEAVVAHLRLLGESNAVIHRQQKLQPDAALAAAAAYRSMFQEEDGTIPATFEVMYLTGWTPHPSQQKPSKRGSQTVSFQDLAAGIGGGGSTNEA